MRELRKRIDLFLKRHRARRAVRRAISIVACVVIVAATYALALPALTLESIADCGIEEHEHTDGCYESVLICGQEESEGHHHSEACYDEGGALICGQEEFEGHQHSDACYEQRLVCGKEVHIHSEDCYSHAEETPEEPADTEAEPEESAHVEAEPEKTTDAGAEPEKPADAEAEPEESADAKAEPEESAVVDARQEEAAHSDKEKTAEAAGQTPQTAAQEEVIPQLEKIDFAEYLTDETTVYYWNEDEEDWERIHPDGEADPEEDVRLNAEQDILLHVGFKLPAGTLNATNAETAYTLPVLQNLTDREVDDNNADRNVIYYGTDRRSDRESAGRYEIKEERDGDATSRRLVITFGQDACAKNAEIEGYFEIRLQAGDLVNPDKPLELEHERITVSAEDGEKEIASYWIAWNDDDWLDTEVYFQVEQSAAEDNTETQPGEVQPAAGDLEEEQPAAEEVSVIEAYGDGYHITVTYGKDSGIPEGAELRVSEVTPETAGGNANGTDSAQQYDDYVEKAEKALDLEKGSAGYVRLFDIEIVKDGEKVQPADGKTVDVRIELSDVQSAPLKVVHIADEAQSGDVVSNQTAPAEDGEIVSFAAEGFSVYAVVDGSTDEYARMELDFYNGEQAIASMFVKNSDTADELESIVYDPGAGTVAHGESFVGWILDKPDYTTADIANVWTIDQVREWALNKEITEGERHRLDAVICRFYTITYKDDDSDHTVIGRAAVPVKASDYGETSVEYIVRMAYTPKDDIHNFEGWILDEDSYAHVTSEIPADGIYQNNTAMNIKGDISFVVNEPAGNWLIFDENGKGGTYNAPQFVKAGEGTVKPRPDTEMTRNGYTFGGWYDTKEHADAHGADPSVTTGAYTFGGELSVKTTLYASWIPVQRAPYTVILWGQNQDRTAYEVKGTYVGMGTVGQNIPYTVRENGDEDYVTGVGANNGHYTGFSIIDADKNQQIKITPEGDAVLNLHYDRITYNMRIYLYRRGTGNNSYQYAQNSNAGKNVWNIATWYGGTSLNNMPTTTYGPIYNEQRDGYTGYYILLSAYYGGDISAKWPKYSQISGPANNRSPVSFAMMNGTGLRGNGINDNGYGTGRDTIKGLITIMDEKILGATNDANGNYLIVRFNTYNDWRYHIWYETVDGEDYTGKTLRTYNGKTYYEADVLEVRSSNTDVAQQNPPQYTGFTYLTRRNQNWNGDGRWTTSNPTRYHINYVYNRDTYKIDYFDGSYVDGNGNLIQNRATHPLHESGEIAHGATIPAADRNYVPTLPEGEAGCVFEGWYLDEACTTPYVWGTMPVGGIKVYAKWRQVQYRVIMHPNAGTDSNLDWGSDTVSMSFRVDYGGKVSTPTGKREGSGYEFVGWYTDPACSSDHLFNSDFELNEETVTTAYDKTEPTELDKWGNPTSPENRDVDRPWITKKLDLYAKWRKILEGSDGITVEYTADDGKGHVGTNAPTDESIYPDQAEAIAQAASTAPAGMEFKYWVMQDWDETAGDYVDTETFYVPGQHFIVDESMARKEPVEEDPGKFTYTIRLRAEYGTPGSEYPTHIWWFKNYSDDSSERHESSREDEGIMINETVDIMTPPTRPGYTFLGWARIPTGQSESEPAAAEGAHPTGKVLPELGPDDLYLKYEDGNFKLNDPTSEYDGAVVTKVAADERLQYHDMYAVWEKSDQIIKIYKVDDSDVEVPLQDAGFSINSQTLTTDETGYTATVALTPSAQPYPLVETAAPAHYEGLSEAVPVTVTASGVTIPAGIENVTISGPDINGVYTIKVVNPRERYTVKVVKNVTGVSTDQEKGFDFTANGVGADPDEAEQFTLYGRAASASDTSDEHLHEITYSNIPYGTVISVAESDTYTDFATAIHVVNGSETPVDLEALTTGDITVKGDVEITYTNTRNRIPLKVVKTDQEGNPLEGATFIGDFINESVVSTIAEVTGSDASSSEAEAGSGAASEAIIIDEASVPLGDYSITETKAPDGYILLEGPVSMSVKREASGDISVTALLDGKESGFVKAERIDTSKPELGWKVTVINNAGVKLPSTGGPGTAMLYLSGIMLTMIAGAGLLFRRKIRK